MFLTLLKIALENLRSGTNWDFLNQGFGSGTFEQCCFSSSVQSWTVRKSVETGKTMERGAHSQDPPELPWAIFTGAINPSVI
jgi:hypothetical protein